MTNAEAKKIFADIKSGKYTVAEVAEAIIEVVQMPNHKSIKKEDMLNAIEFLLELLNDALPDESEEESADEE